MLAAGDADLKHDPTFFIFIDICLLLIALARKSKPSAFDFTCKMGPGLTGAVGIIIDSSASRCTPAQSICLSPLLGRAEEKSAFQSAFTNRTLTPSLTSDSSLVRELAGPALKLSHEGAKFTLQFGQEKYEITPDEIFPVQVQLNPAPPAGLFSYGVKITFDRTLARVVDGMSINVPDALNFIVHICLDENQAEFDQQNGLLAKLLNDSLNEDKIQAALKAQPPI